MFDLPEPKLNPEEITFSTFTFKKQVEPVTDFAKILFSDTPTNTSHGEIIHPHEQPNFYQLEKHRGTSIVDMDDYGIITAANNKQTRIATHGLSGCTAVAVAVEFADGNRTGYVQHYSPLRKLLGADMLRGMLANLGGDIKTAQAVIMTPGQWTMDPEVDYAMNVEDETLTCLLTTVTRAGLGPEADVHVYPYSENQIQGKYGQGTLMVEFNPDATTKIYAEALPIELLPLQ